jgi:hypothetical protein
MSEIRQNPFPTASGWRWRDDNGVVHPKIYPSQLEALYDMLKYIEYLKYGPTYGQRLWWPIRYGLWPYLRDTWRRTAP